MAVREKLMLLFKNSAPAEVLKHLEGLDDANLLYFAALYEQKINPKQAKKLRIDDGSPRQSGELAAYPTAIAPPELLRHLPYVHYEDLLNDTKRYAAAAAKCALWVKKTQAGGGTSILRSKYLARRLAVPEESVKTGSKGTDLYVDAGGGREISLAEVQILQALQDLSEKKFHSIYYHDIVSSESRNAIHEIWKARKFSAPGFQRFGETFQALLPTLDDEGRLSLRRTAPGGHAFFAVEALFDALDEKKRPSTGEAPLVAVIGNGEDLGSTPDAAVVGWMIENKIGAAMITTEKTENDLKGGQIALVKDDDGFVCAALIEQAQAKEAGQLALFESLGLDVKKPGQMAFFNTNVVLINYSELVPKIRRLAGEIGEDEFLKIITPTLIENKKMQTDASGRVHTFDQLEGAMGSSFLNLDRYWRRRYHEPLIHFVNVGRQNRTRFFSPVKSAFDFFMLFHSDRFKLESPSMRLKNLNPGRLPQVSLDGLDKDFYAEVQNVLDCFEGTNIKDLDALQVKGNVAVRGITFRGRVDIKSEFPALFDLVPHLSADSNVLDGKSVFVSKKGDVKIESQKI